MFTGIIEEEGKILDIDKSTHSAVLKIEAKKVLEDSKIGDSIAVNGVCLTAKKIGAGYFLADVMHESLKRSSLASLKRGSRVNLERALQVSSRLGGHLVSGHIDGVGEIIAINKDDNAVLYDIKADKKILKYIVEKGSVAIDGISLTVAEVDLQKFRVAVIPHTRASTNLVEKKLGSLVNIENDCIGKYVEKFLLNIENDNNLKDKEKNSISREFLIKNGF